MNLFGGGALFCFGFEKEAASKFGFYVQILRLLLDGDSENFA